MGAFVGRDTATGSAYALFLSASVCLAAGACFARATHHTDDL
jgi:hypothetical protein